MSLTNPFYTDNLIFALTEPSYHQLGGCFEYSVELKSIASMRSSSNEIYIWKEEDDDSNVDDSDDDDTDENKDEDEEEDNVITVKVDKDNIQGFIFLPGCYLAVSYSNEDDSIHSSPNNGIRIYSIPSKKIVFETGEFDRNLQGSMMMAAPPGNNLLFGNFDGCLVEFKVDLSNKKVADKKILFHQKEEICLLCCSRNSYKICFKYTRECNFYYLELSPDGETVTNLEHMTYCFIDGEKKGFDEIGVCDIGHDGEHIIVAFENEIIALESASDGSIGHVIVTSGLPCLNNGPLGGIALGDYGQLLVCEWNENIEVYQYKSPNTVTLQGICRSYIINLLSGTEKVDDLPIPITLKKYLLNNL